MTGGNIRRSGKMDGALGGGCVTEKQILVWKEAHEGSVGDFSFFLRCFRGYFIFFPPHRYFPPIGRDAVRPAAGWFDKPKCNYVLHSFSSGLVITLMIMECVIHCVSICRTPANVVTYDLHVRLLIICHVISGSCRRRVKVIKSNL